MKLANLMLVTQLFRFQENYSFGIKGDEPVLYKTGNGFISVNSERIMPWYLNKLNLPT